MTILGYQSAVPKIGVPTALLGPHLGDKMPLDMSETLLPRSIFASFA
jgi:hypothetical protein